ncbi:MAG: hypothetical protein SH857_02210 [Chitinophagales bacterium]|nr:hypothetical protein [Chitinophagales bacterium]
MNSISGKGAKAECSVNVCLLKNTDALLTSFATKTTREGKEISTRQMSVEGGVLRVEKNNSRFQTKNKNPIGGQSNCATGL